MPKMQEHFSALPRTVSPATPRSPYTNSMKQKKAHQEVGFFEYYSAT
jgi:hypothetical protein